MGKIERFPVIINIPTIPKTPNSYVDIQESESPYYCKVLKSDLDELEQQRDEFYQLFIQVTRRIEKDVVTFEEEMGEVPERFLKIYKNYTKTLERITGKSWEEIKAGKHE